MVHEMPHTIVIIGAGASGTLLAAQLLRTHAHALHITLIERDPPIGRGVAYRTTHEHHLLNVPAGKMSAYGERPQHFLQWLTRYAETAHELPPPGLQSFVPRQLYGAYLYDVLEEAKASSVSSTLEQVHDEVLDIHEVASGLEIVLKSGQHLQAHQCVLATGTIESYPPFLAQHDFFAANRYTNNPWSPHMLASIAPSAPVLLLGSGLTMIDIALSFHAEGHTGPLFAVSRRGVVPYAHHAAALPAKQLSPQDFPPSLRALLHWLRTKCQETREEESDDWRTIVDALRPYISTIWQSWSAEEQGQFLCHVQPYWDVLRHRISPAAARTIAQMRESKQLQVYAGRIERYAVTPREAIISLRLRGTQETRTLRVQHIINCTGPGRDIRNSNNVCLQKLLSRGMIRPDQWKLGIDTDDHGAIISLSGTISSSVYTLGPLRKGTLWETTALPEIRAQAAQLAHHLLQRR